MLPGLRASRVYAGTCVRHAGAALCSICRILLLRPLCPWAPRAHPVAAASAIHKLNAVLLLLVPCPARHVRHALHVAAAGRGGQRAARHPEGRGDGERCGGGGWVGGWGGVGGGCTKAGKRTSAATSSWRVLRMLCSHTAARVPSCPPTHFRRHFCSQARLVLKRFLLPWQPPQ